MPKLSSQCAPSGFYHTHVKHLSACRSSESRINIVKTGVDDDAVSNLADEGEKSVREGDINGEISKSLFNIESSTRRRSDRISNKNTHKAACCTYTLELYFSLSNPMTYLRKINNETYTFREMMK